MNDWPTVEEYAVRCSQVLMREVTVQEVLFDLDNLNQEIMEYVAALRCGVTTETVH